MFAWNKHDVEPLIRWLFQYVNDSRAVAGKLRDATVNFGRYGVSVQAVVFLTR